MSFLSGRLTVSGVFFGCALMCTGAGFGARSVEAQEAVSLPPVPESQASVELPDAPRPQIELATLVAAFDQPANADEQLSGSGTSSSEQQTDSTQQKPQKTQQQIGDEQVKEQEKQRVGGVIPSFNISYRPDAVALTVKQKFNLAFHTAIDPVTFATAFVTGGYHEVFDGDRVLAKGSTTVYIRENGTGFEWGPKGYFERSGAGYLDAFDGTIIGNAVFPSLFHQDPRFFRMGHGPFMKRLLFSASTSFICKGDKSRKWQPNFGNVLGNITGGEISNFYYPSGNPTQFGTTISTAMIQTVEGSLGSVFQEFWPDFSRKFLHKDPTHGLDAQYQNAENDEKAQKKK